jgi:Flp pilus assembly protein TadG
MMTMPPELLHRSTLFGTSPLDALRGERGSSLIELALILPVLLLMLVGSIDFGRAFFVAIEVSSAAEAGVDYGIQQAADTSGCRLPRFWMLRT